MNAIVLLHAFPLDHRMWDGVCDEIAKSGWQVFAPDLRGCGNAADWVDEDAPTLRTLAEDVLGILDKFGITRVVAGGCSLGGYVVMELMRIAPERIAGAIFIDTKASADDAVQVANRLRVAQQVQDVQSTEAFWRAMLPNVLGKTTHENSPEVVEYTKFLMQDSRVNGVSNLQIAMSRRIDSHETIANFSGPILSIRGSEDLIASADDHSNIVNAAQDAIHVEIAECGHLAPIEKADETASVIVDFLHQISSPSC